MRGLLLVGVLGVLAACHESGPPSCGEVAAQVAEHLGGPKQAIPLVTRECEQEGWSGPTRTCVAAARGEQAVVACLPDELRIKKLEQARAAVIRTIEKQPDAAPAVRETLEQKRHEIDLQIAAAKRAAATARGVEVPKKCLIEPLAEGCPK